ncbi:MAG: outer membrane protein transport protein [Thermodesulfobacteriota bacterium]
MKLIFKSIAIVFLTVMLSTSAFATNGDNLIAIGPVARAMGGVGTAYPLDAISAVFANPAAMCFGEYCPASEFNFSGTLFMPKIDTKITNAALGTYTAESDDKVYAIPAIGFSVPMGSGPSNWRFGLAAYGVTGLGVDYRGTAIDINPPAYGGAFPLVSGSYTALQIMKFAPAISFQPTTRLSVGLGLHIDYASLDLRSGSSFNYAFGLQPGVIYKPTDHLSIGLTYTTPQSVDHENVSDFDSDGTLDTLTLEAPQQFALGVAHDFFSGKLLIEADVKWINWSDAKGYGKNDFDWEDQWVFGVGAQVEPVSNLYVRAGYNYGENPVKEHQNFSGLKTVQGKTMPAYYYETFRIVGFPAIVEQHLTFGIGYKFTDRLKVDLGYMHAFENTIRETGTDFMGNPVTLESSLSESSIDFGLTWRF